MYRDVPLALVSEMFHEASRLFRTASESRAKEREKAPTAKHDRNLTIKTMVESGAGVKPSGRIRVCDIRFLAEEILFCLMGLGLSCSHWKSPESD